MEKSADYFKFSAEGLSGNPKTIKFALSGELKLQFCPNYVQVLPKSLIKSYQHVFIKKSLSDKLHIFLSENFGVKINALFPQIFLG